MVGKLLSGQDRVAPLLAAPAKKEGTSERRWNWKLHKHVVAEDRRQTESRQEC